MKARVLLAALALVALPACNISQVFDTSGPDDTVAQVGPGAATASGGSDGSGTFSYAVNNPPDRERWPVRQAERSETHIWAVYEDPSDSDNRELWAMEFVTRDWVLWKTGRIIDIEPGMYMTLDQGPGGFEVELAFVEGVEIGMEYFNDRVSGAPALDGFTIERGAGPTQAQVLVYASSTTAWRRTGFCCPEEWELLRNDGAVISGSTIESLDGFWGGVPGVGGGWASTTNTLWQVTPFAWDPVQGIGGGSVNLAVDRVGNRVYGTRGCSLFSVENKQATIIEPAAGQDTFGGVLCDLGLGSLAVDVDGPNKYLSFGMTYSGETLWSSWLGTPDITGPDAATELQVFNQAYQPTFLFADPTAFGDVWVYQREVLAQFPDVPAGWLHIQDPLTLPWKDPHPLAGN